MSFQDSAESLRSQLHLERFSPTALVISLVLGAMVLVCLAYSLVGLISSHSFEVMTAHEGVSSEDAGEVEGEDQAGGQVPAENEKQVVVYISGNVCSPGVYSLPEGSRVSDAVHAAGGFDAEAATEAINLARLLTDGEQVHVASRQETLDMEASSPVGQIDGSTGASNSFSGLININTASADDLMELDGVGESTAQKIIAERTQNGFFSSIEDIKRVSGIGDKRFEAIKDRICV